ncbi:MAG: hypothetical protein ACYTG0_21555 [Planctomycetota bacterium]|jgi:hypothetical protein
MIHDPAWFEMSDKRKPRLATASWVPLYARQAWSELKYAEPGHWEEYFGAVAITFPAENEGLVDQVEWTHANRNGNRPHVEDGQYLPAGRFVDWSSDLEGDYLVLRNWFDTGDPDDILIEPDLILGLRLLREGDRWLAPYEDYVPVIRLQKDADGRVVLVEIRGEHLKDYLSARDCGLLVSTFRSRREISADVPPFELPESWKESGTHWEGRICEIDVDGSQYGSSVAVISMGRTDVDPDDDAPVMEFPTDGNTWSSKREFRRLGPKRYRTIGEMWRNEWIAPGERSPRLRGDRETSNIEFIVDNSGERLKASELVGLPSRWLWFSPTVVNELLSHRGTKLIWYTEDTAGLSLPAEGVVHFGINEADLVNVYAKDIGQLGVLWQKLWVAWNVTPDGKVAHELLSSQMEARPADSVAPEQLLEFAVDRVDEKFTEKFGARLFRDHSAETGIRRNVHRFTAVDENGLYRLMKELTRLCVERLDMSQLKTLTPNADKSLGSLKRLELILNDCGVNGRDSVRELVGIYDLRHSDAHLPSSDVDDALSLVGLSPDLPPMKNGKKAIQNVAECFLRIAESLHS